VILTDIHSHEQAPSPADVLRVHNTTPRSFAVQQGQYFTCGIHPLETDDADRQFEALEQVTNNPFCIGIGECGLDRRSKETYEVQKKVFAMQTELATRKGLPLLIHSVRSHSEVISFLRRNVFLQSVVFHGFSNRLALLREILSLPNTRISIHPGVLSFPRVFYDILEATPDNRLHLESDEYGIEDFYHLHSEVSKAKKTNDEKLAAILRENACSAFPRLRAVL